MVKRPKQISVSLNEKNTFDVLLDEEVAKSAQTKSETIERSFFASHFGPNSKMAAALRIIYEGEADAITEDVTRHFINEVLEHPAASPEYRSFFFLDFILQLKNLLHESSHRSNPLVHGRWYECKKDYLIYQLQDIANILSKFIERNVVACQLQQDLSSYYDYGRLCSNHPESHIDEEIYRDVKSILPNRPWAQLVYSNVLARIDVLIDKMRDNLDLSYLDIMDILVDSFDAIYNYHACYAILKEIVSIASLNMDIFDRDRFRRIVFNIAIDHEVKAAQQMTLSQQQENLQRLLSACNMTDKKSLGASEWR